MPLNDAILLFSNATGIALIVQSLRPSTSPDTCTSCTSSLCYSAGSPFWLRPPAHPIVLRYLVSFTGKLKHPVTLPLAENLFLVNRRETSHWVRNEHRKHLTQRRAHWDVCTFSITIGISCWKTAQSNARNAVSKHPGWPSFWVLFLDQARKSTSPYRAN